MRLVYPIFLYLFTYISANKSICLLDVDIHLHAAGLLTSNDFPYDFPNIFIYNYTVILLYAMPYYHMDEVVSLRIALQGLPFAGQGLY